MEFSSKKYLALMVLVCIIFVIIIVKAYDYLPDKSVENYNNPMINTQAQNINNTQNFSQDNTNNQTSNLDQNYDPNRHKSGHIDYMHNETRSYNKNDFEEINAPKGTNEDNIQTFENSNTSQLALTSDELAIRALFNANKLKSSSDYNSAITELQKVAEYTSDKEILATSYEKIAELYAIQRRYGTALSFAGKAYSTSPNVNREMLIARIYYQSGETDNAVSRLNNILSKGFRD